MVPSRRASAPSPPTRPNVKLSSVHLPPDRRASSKQLNVAPPKLRHGNWINPESLTKQALPRTSGIGPKLDPSRLCPPKTLTHTRYFLLLEKCEREIAVLSPGIRKAGNHSGTPEEFGSEPRAMRPELHQIIDQQLHRIDAETCRRDCRSRSFRQEKMVHPTNLRRCIIQAARHAGSENGRDRPRAGSTSEKLALRNMLGAQFLPMDHC